MVVMGVMVPMSHGVVSGSVMVATEVMEEVLLSAAVPVMGVTADVVIMVVMVATEAMPFSLKPLAMVVTVAADGLQARVETEATHTTVGQPAMVVMGETLSSKRMDSSSANL